MIWATLSVIYDELLPELIYYTVPTYLYQEISDDLMEKMARLSQMANPLPADAAKSKTVLTYFVPYPFQEVVSSAIFIKESPSLLASAGTTGHRTWDACLHLATYLATEGRGLIAGKSVLELGVGTGLLSIICAGPLSAAYVLATDGDPDVDRTIRTNIDLNQHLSTKYSRQLPLESKVLEWGTAANVGSIPPSKGGNVLYETILGADLTYSPDSLEPLASTLGQLATLCPSADIVISATLRVEDTFDIFLAYCLEHGLSVYDVDFRCPPLELQKGLFHSLDPPIRIVRMKKERSDRPFI